MAATTKQKQARPSLPAKNVEESTRIDISKVITETGKSSPANQVIRKPIP